MYRLTRLTAALLALASGAVGGPGVDSCGAETTRRQEAGEQAESTTALAITPIAPVAEDPARYRDSRLRLVGRLENQGDNYFTDLRVVLEDEQGAFLHVVPWLPVHLPPGPRRGAGKRPEVLSDYLGKKVELIATVEESMPELARKFAPSRDSSSLISRALRLFVPSSIMFIARLDVPSSANWSEA